MTYIKLDGPCVHHTSYAGRSLTFWHAASYKLHKVTSNARDVLVDDRRKHFVTFRFNGRKQTRFVLAWKRSRR